MRIGSIWIVAWMFRFVNIFLISLLLVSCGDDTDYTASWIGSWTIEAVVDDEGVYSLQSYADALSSLDPLFSVIMTGSCRFGSDGTFVMRIHVGASGPGVYEYMDYAATGIYAVEQESYSMKVLAEDVDSSDPSEFDTGMMDLMSSSNVGSWFIDGDRLTLASEDGSSLLLRHR